MSAKAYKAKIDEPLIQKLRALIKTALFRYFEDWDNYHITNGNLYRENEKLSKINDKLKNDNENLIAENKDYKLLRKVFGHKQLIICLNRQEILKVISVKIHAKDKWIFVVKTKWQIQFLKKRAALTSRSVTIFFLTYYRQKKKWIHYRRMRYSTQMIFAGKLSCALLQFANIRKARCVLLWNRATSNGYVSMASKRTCWTRKCNRRT